MPVIHEEANGMRTHGWTLDIAPRQAGKSRRWEMQLARLIESGRFQQIFIGARQFLLDPDGYWREVK